MRVPSEELLALVAELFGVESTQGEATVELVFRNGSFARAHIHRRVTLEALARDGADGRDVPPRP